MRALCLDGGAAKDSCVAHGMGSPNASCAPRIRSWHPMRLHMRASVELLTHPILESRACKRLRYSLMRCKPAKLLCGGSVRHVRCLSTLYNVFYSARGVHEQRCNSRICVFFIEGGSSRRPRTSVGVSKGPAHRRLLTRNSIDSSDRTHRLQLTVHKNVTFILVA